MSRVHLLPLLLALGLGVARADDADDVGGTYVVRAGRVFARLNASPGPRATPQLMDTEYSPGLIFVRDGKVVDVQPGFAPIPEWMPVIDRSHATVIPGLVAAQLELGSGRRADASLGAQYLAVDGYDTYADQQALLAAGITTAFLHPGRGRLVTGRGGVVKLAGRPERRILTRIGDLCAELGEAALGPPAEVEIPVPSSSDNPIRPGTPQVPSTRASLTVALRDQLAAALRYQRDRERLPAGERPAFDPDLAALAESLLAGGLRIDARRARELRGALALAAELGLQPLLVGATEVGPLIPAVADVGAPVLYEVPLELAGQPRDRRSDRLGKEAVGGRS